MSVKLCSWLLLCLVPVATAQQGSKTGEAPAPAATSSRCTGICSDIPPSSLFTCKQQVMNTSRLTNVTIASGQQDPTCQT